VCHSDGVITETRFGMDVNRAVNDFLTQGKNLFHLIRSDGIQLSDAELVMLRVQLHLLDSEAIITQSRKQFFQSKHRSQVPLPGV
jgi:hypothetical protein